VLTSEFGASGLTVSKVGFGAGHLGNLSEAESGALLNGALDAGVTLFDAARSYGEEQIARALSHRRREFVLSTKGGYGVPGVPDWTGEAIRRGVELALRTLRTEWIDVFHLHSCPLETLQREEILRACEDVARSGKVRAMAYSGENDALAFAIRSGKFASVQCSVNLFDQRMVLDGQLREARERGLGVIGKRPVGNAPWRFETEPHEHYAHAYWLRWRAMELDAGGLSWLEYALRYAAFAPGVSSVIVGTGSLSHLRENLALVERGPLPPELVHRARDAFKNHDRDWVGQV
jgi:aryl-alcohol dehydrogenase-like predicted oxidoreductase